MHKSLKGWMAAATLILTGTAWAQASLDMQVAEGRRIYLEGILPGGVPLSGTRPGLEPVTGRNAACVNCHRPSGLGGVEGTVAVPPITGRALFGGAEPVVVRQDRRFDAGLSTPHPPYSMAGFATALRSGTDHAGSALGLLMPRYAVDDAHVQSLAAYLDTLSARWSPGAFADQVQVATVIAPGMEPDRRRAFLATLTSLVRQMNSNVTSGQRQKLSAIERRMSARRKLDLEVWELEGPASTWADQLAQHQQRKPAFALLSGLGGMEWQPVQDFCDRQSVVCWFPSLDLIPQDAAKSPFSFYLADGVRTEARAVASQAGAETARVVQLLGKDPRAQAGAQALREALAPRIPVRELDAGDPDLGRQLLSLEPGTLVMAWLAAREMPLLERLPAGVGQVYLSASLAGDEPPAPAAVAGTPLLLAQTLEQPDVRKANLARFDAWQEGSHVPLVDRRMQSEVYFATRSLVTMLRGMLNNLHTPYLVERAESTLGMFEAMQVQEEVQALMMAPVNKRPVTGVPLAATDGKARLDTLLQRGGTTMYPRLSLAPGQRIASKGAYIQALTPSPVPVPAEPVWVTP